MTNEEKQNRKPRASEDKEKTGRPPEGVNEPKSLEKKQKKKKAENTMGGRICKLRLNAEMSQEDLAEKTGIDSSRISRIENDKLEPRCWEIEEMCYLFDVTADYIIRGIENLPANLDLTPDEKKLVIGLLEKLKNC